MAKKKKTNAKKPSPAGKQAPKKTVPAGKDNKKILLICGCALLAALLIIGGILLFRSPKETAPSSGNAGTASSPAVSNTEPGAVPTGGQSGKDPTHYADIDIKDYGVITVALYGNTAPITVENFVSLAESGFYDGLTFHRIMEGFMMQGGDPDGNGTGGSDKTIVGEFSSNGIENPLSHTRGAISMARATPPDSASSQFFIVHQDSDFLDGNYAVFGYVTSGIEVVDKVCSDARPVDDNGTIPAAQQPIINSITIRPAE